MYHGHSQSFRTQLATTPIHSLSLTYPQLLSKLLILLNHSLALHTSLSSSLPPPQNQYELPSVRETREEAERWKSAGSGGRTRVGNVGVVVRGRGKGLEGTEMEEAAIQELIITNQVGSHLVSHHRRS